MSLDKRNGMLNVLESEYLLSSHDVVEIKDYIREKYPNYTSKKSAEVFANTVNNILDGRLYSFSKENRWVLKDTIYKKAVTKRKFSISARDVVEGVSSIGKMEDKIFNELEIFATKILGKTVSKEMLLEELSNQYYIPRSLQNKGVEKQQEIELSVKEDHSVNAIIESVHENEDLHQDQKYDVLKHKEKMHDNEKPRVCQEQRSEYSRKDNGLFGLEKYENVLLDHGGVSERENLDFYMRELDGIKKMGFSTPVKVEDLEKYFIDKKKERKGLLGKFFILFDQKREDEVEKYLEEVPIISLENCLWDTKFDVMKKVHKVTMFFSNVIKKLILTIDFIARNKRWLMEIAVVSLVLGIIFVYINSTSLNFHVSDIYSSHSQVKNGEEEKVEGDITKLEDIRKTISFMVDKQKK